MHIYTKKVPECKSKKFVKILYYLVNHGVTYRKIKDGPNIFHAVMVPKLCNHETHNALGHNGSTRLYNFIKRHYYCRKLHQYYNKYVRSCPEYQQVTLKETLYLTFHLPILQFLMSFISMDLLGPYCETENGK